MGTVAERARWEVSFLVFAREFALAKAVELESKAASIGVMRSVDATEAAKWLNEIAAAIREAAGPDEQKESPNAE